MDERDIDILLYGASGFVGKQVARYLAERARDNGLRIAIAGRDRAKLVSVRAAAGEGIAQMLVADAYDAAAIDAIVSRSRIVLNTAGPFAKYGDTIVDACVRHRTHYVDITGETPWIRDLIDRHHERAAADGTRIVPACGFDSVPSDIGTYLVARHVRDSLGTGCRSVRAYFTVAGGFNGGTIASMLSMAENTATMQRIRDPFLLDPRGEHSPEDIRANDDPRRPVYDAAIDAWTAPFLMGPVNTRVVRRSAALFASLRQPYGASFSYQEYMRVGGKRSRLRATIVTVVLGLVEAAIANADTRRLIQPLLPKPGDGPSDQAIRSGFFRCELIGTSDEGRTVRATIGDRGDPGNAATVKFVCESALALALDASALPGGSSRGGVLTPATALGDALVVRLRAAGMTIALTPTEAPVCTTRAL